MEAVQKLDGEYGLRVRDCSNIYSGYKDLNDYITGQKLAQSADLIQSIKQAQQEKPAEKQERQPSERKSRGFRM
jgi:hypothetical protein